jgi:hypothetical protein
MQRSLLPRDAPDVPGLEVGEVYESSARVDVGGDIYDFVQLDDGRLAVVLGDVTGHGVEATADMAMAKFVFRSLAREHPEPGDFLAFANDVVVDEIAPGKFITMTYLAVDPGRGEVACANAGHPPPRLVLPNGTVRGLEAPGIVLGIDSGQTYEEVRTELPVGSTIVLYTDGVVEARNGGELYGTERLTGGRLPYLDPCPRDAGEQCDEYPVLTMYFMRTSAWISQGVAGLAGHTPTYAGFFYANALLLVLCALATTWALWRMAGVRALYFALAPTLLIYGFVNWDLLAVALATCGTLTYLRRRDALAGIFLGLGTAAKLYPALLLIPFVLGRLRERRSADAWTLIGVAGTTYALANLPFVIASPPLLPTSWARRGAGNSTRPPPSPT